MSSVHSENRLSMNDLRDRFRQSICDLDFNYSRRSQRVPAHFESAHLNSVDIFKTQGFAVRDATRSALTSDSGLDDFFLLAIPLNFAYEIAQAGHEARVAPGALCLIETSKPFQVRMCNLSAEDTQQGLFLRVPAQSLRQRIPRVEQFCGQALDTEQGAGSILKTMLESLLIQSRSMHPAQAAMFGEMLLNVSSMAILDAKESGQPTIPSGEKAQVRLRLAARGFIEANLADPTLDVAAVARFCRVSKRYLCAAFESTEEGAGLLIRELRLQKCRADLLNPALRHYSLTQIAAKWGFSSSSNFARAYRARFSCTPREERH